MGTEPGRSFLCLTVSPSVSENQIYRSCSKDSYPCQKIYRLNVLQDQRVTSLGISHNFRAGKNFYFPTESAILPPTHTHTHTILKRVENESFCQFWRCNKCLNLLHSNLRAGDNLYGEFCLWSKPCVRGPKSQTHHHLMLLFLIIVSGLGVFGPKVGTLTSLLNSWQRHFFN